MDVGFCTWIKRAYTGSAGDHQSIHNELGTTDGICTNDRTWHTLCNMYWIAKSDPCFPAAGGEEDYREYFVNVFSNPSESAKYGVLTIPAPEVESAFQLLHRRYLREIAMGPDEFDRRVLTKIRGEARVLSTPVNVMLWVASILVGFCFVPYLDVFSGYGRFDPSDIEKPILYGAFASVIIRAIVGAFIGERPL